MLRATLISWVAHFPVGPKSSKVESTLYSIVVLRCKILNIEKYLIALSEHAGYVSS